MSSPKISVLMSVYNGEDFLAETIKSVLNQTFTDFEFLIIDDGSSDSSGEIVKSFNDERIVLIRNESSLGLTRNLANGVNSAKGEYIARIDADDLMMPTRLEKQFTFMENNSEISVVGSAMQTFGDIDLIWGNPEGDAYIKSGLLFSSALYHPSVMIRKSFLVNSNTNYNPDFKYAQDYRLWTDVLIANGKFANVSEPLTKYRVHSSSITSTKKPEQIALADRIRRELAERLGIEFTDKEIALLKVINNSYTGLDLKSMDTIFCKYISGKHVPEHLNIQFLKIYLRKKIIEFLRSSGLETEALWKALQSCKIFTLFEKFKFFLLKFKYSDPNVYLDRVAHNL